MIDSPLTPKQVRRNFILGIVNGVFFRFFMTLTDPSLVLTWFVSQLTVSPTIIGLLMPISKGGWFLPQLLISQHVQKLPRKMALYHIISIGRFLSWLAVTVLLFVLGDRNPRLLLVLFFLLFTAYHLISGLGGICFMAIVGKAVPARSRGTFLGLRNLGGGLLALAGAAFVRYMLDERRGIRFPLNYGWLLVAAMVAAALGLLAFALVHEPEEDVTSSAKPLPLHVQGARLMREDHNYALFILLRILSLLNSTAMPFYTLFAKERLNAPASSAGTYLTLYTLAVMGSTLLWGPLCDRKGNRVGMLVTTALSTIAPLIVLLFGSQLSYSAFALIYPLLGAVETGIEITSFGYTLDASPAEQRVFYIGFINTVLGVSSMGLMSLGLVVRGFGLGALFALCLATTAASAVLAYRLQEPRAEALRLVTRPEGGRPG